MQCQPIKTITGLCLLLAAATTMVACSTDGGRDATATCVGVGPGFVTLLHLRHNFSAAAHSLQLASATTATTCSIKTGWDCDSGWSCSEANEALNVKVYQLACKAHPSWVHGSQSGQQFAVAITGQERHNLTVSVLSGTELLHKQTIAPSECQTGDYMRFDVDIGPF